MICTKCGAQMMDTDQFCPKCGAKAIKEKRCPECGTLLREGTKFCHKCGSPVDHAESVRKVSQETLDIPFDAIEQNILSETAAEIRADRRTENAPRKTTSAKNTDSRNASGKSAPSHGSSGKSSSSKSPSHGSSGKSSSSKSPSHNTLGKSAPPPKKRANYREEEDWDDDDWEDEDDDEGIDTITVMTAIVGCVLLLVVAVLGYQLYRRYVPKNYDRVAQEEQESQDDETEIPGQEVEELPESSDSGEDTYTLTVIQNVNVRDNPSTSGTNVLKVAKKGETYTSTGSVDDGQWYVILLEDGTTGYVFHEYVTIE